jgi:polyhydroxyalkanoate synthesis regulator phasin
MAEDDLLRRLLDAGMTFSAMTQARAEALIRDLVKQGEVQAEQAQATIDELLDRSRRNSERWLEAIRSEIDQQITKLDLATRGDIERAVQRFADTAAAVFQKMMPERFGGQAEKPTATAPTATASGAAKKSAAKATGTTKKTTGAAKPAAAKKAPAKKAGVSAKKAGGATKKAAGTAKKATGSAKKTTARKTTGTAKKATGSAKKATGSAKKATGSAKKTTAKKAPAKKAGGSAG